MRRILLRPFTLVAVLIAAQGILFASSPKTAWISGRVISTGLHGHGNTGRNLRSQDVWWSYCIFSGDQTYTVLSRENPARSGLKANSAIRFIERQNRIYVLNPAGKRIALKILRKGIGSKCP